MNYCIGDFGLLREVDASGKITTGIESSMAILIAETDDSQYPTNPTQYSQSNPQITTSPAPKNNKKTIIFATAGVLAVIGTVYYLNN